MSNASDAFVRVPPDSTGKRVHAAERTVVYFDNLQTGQSFSVGQTVVGSVSSAQGEIVGITTVGFTSGKGYLQSSGRSSADILWSKCWIKSY